MALRTEFALLSFLALTTTPGCCAITVDGTLALRGGASLPQSVLALSGSALSLSGLATLIDPKWIDEDEEREPNKLFGGLRDKLLPKSAEARTPRYRRVLARLGSGVVLCGWGLTKLAVARLSGPVLQNFYKLNLPAVAGLIALQCKRGRAGFLPMELQAVIASLYLGSAMGITKIGKIGDKYPDRFLEYMPGRLHLV